MFVGVLLEHRVRKHGQHELSLDSDKGIQEVPEVLLPEEAVVVTAIGTDIRRINEVEGILTVITLYDVGTVLALDGHVVQPCTQILGKLILCVPELLSGRPVTVIAERAVDHRGEAQLGAQPHGPGTLHRREILRKLIDVPGVGVLLPRVERAVDQALKSRVFRLGDLVEVHQFGVDIVDNLALRRLLGKEDCAASAERLGVEAMLRDERQDVLQERLLPAVIRYGCFRFLRNSILMIINSRARPMTRMADHLRITAADD